MKVLLCSLFLIGFVFAANWPEDWSIGVVVNPDTEVSFTLALKQQNLEELNRVFTLVTTPGSSEYGNYRTIQELTDIIAPSKEEQQQVLDYLISFGCEAISYGDFITATGPASAVERIFQVKFYEFKHRIHQMILHRSPIYPKIPQDLKHVVAFVTGISTFPPTRKPSERYSKLAATDTWVVPQTLRAMYGLSSSNVGSNSKNSMAVVEFGVIAGISQQDLDQFNQLTNGPSNAKLAYTVGTFGFTPISPIDGESTLDVQYIMAVAPNVPCSFWTINGWMYDFTTLVQQRQSSNQPVPLVFSMSYAWAEADQCEVTGNGDTCAQVGGSDYSYVSTTSTNFQKLGATGITLLSASGDAGAASKENLDCTNSTTPIRPNFPASSPYITTVGGTMLQNGGTSLSGTLPPFCKQVGVTCAGGGTEIVCSVPQALITSGGGFSNDFPAPSYQTSNIAAWQNTNAKKPPSQYYNSTGRAYPDVSALAHHYMIVENGKQLGVDGTSASTPVTAGLIALINDQRLNAGKSPVGFINPALYQMSSSSFTDVTIGDNSGTEMHGITGNQYCNTYGYGASSGWDPATGLGTPNFPAWSSYWSSH